MTPLTQFYMRFLPMRLAYCAVALTYAIGLMLLLFLGRDFATDTIYIDLE